MNKYLFIFDLIECDEAGQYWDYEDSHRIIKIYANSKDEAIRKLRLLVPYYINLSWKCEEILEKGVDNDR